MRILALSVIASVTVMAGGYKIPEVSLNGTALSAAYVANAHGADAAYYNPAAMIYNEDTNLLEVDATYIGLSSIDFDGASDYSSKEENFLVPSLHFASKKLGDSGVRAGFSIVVPAGLSKRWENPT
ncbi:MAG: outer membrane protein transport protein, partial [Sulfuricurvum sp.]